MSDTKTTQELLEEIETLKKTLTEREEIIKDLQREIPSDHSLTNEEISRYSRQIFVDLVGVKGQEKLKNSSVLIVGCGGLGCPSAQYVASVGVGLIGLVDYDDVELNNLHRQVLHTEQSIGTSKVDSLASAIERLNKNVKVEKHRCQLSSLNALTLIERYDVVIDATDNVATRYLLNDACVFSSKPLVSGAAVKTEGQLTVYGYKGGPCYRCLFPNPPPQQTVANCGDVGVLPQVPGVIGVLEALQAVHILLDNTEGVLSQRMLLFDGEQTLFRSVRLRNRAEQCAVCGTAPSITSLIDYEQFCGSPANDKMRGVSLLERNDRVTVSELREVLSKPDEGLLLDVRSQTEFQMCRIPGSINIPLEQLDSETDFINNLVNRTILDKVYVLCRRGNDSQIAVTKLRSNHPSTKFVDIMGGLHAWSKNIDPSFPIY